MRYGINTSYHLPYDAPPGKRKLEEDVVSTSDPIRRKIVVDLPQHKIVITENDTVARTITDFSTGRQGHLTPAIAKGKLDPSRRERMHYSHTYKDAHGKPAAMPYALFFNDNSGCAFHAGDPHVESHGCIHLTNDDAAWLFNWAGSHEVGLQIIVPHSDAQKA